MRNALVRLEHPVEKLEHPMENEFYYAVSSNNGTEFRLVTSDERLEALDAEALRQKLLPFRTAPVYGSLAQAFNRHISVNGGELAEFVVPEFPRR